MVGRLLCSCDVAITFIKICTYVGYVAIGEELDCRPERNNAKERYAVVFVKDESLFLRDRELPCWHL